MNKVTILLLGWLNVFLASAYQVDDLKYKIKYHDAKYDETLHLLDNDPVIITYKRNRYICDLPKPQKPERQSLKEQEEQLEIEVEQKNQLKKRAVEIINESFGSIKLSEEAHFMTESQNDQVGLLNDLGEDAEGGKSQSLQISIEEGCINQAVDFWSYSFCYNKTIEQYHDPFNLGFKIKNKDYPNFFRLGKYVKESKTSEIEFVKDGDKNSKAALVQEYTDGDWCKLSESNRAVRVTYSCQEPAAGSVLSDNYEAIYKMFGLNYGQIPKIVKFKEFRTCMYELEISVPGLCQLKPFQSSKEELVKEIDCYRINDMKIAGESIFKQSIDDDSNLLTKANFKDYKLSPLGENFFFGTPKGYIRNPMSVLFTSDLSIDSYKSPNFDLQVVGGLLFKKLKAGTLFPQSRDLASHDAFRYHIKLFNFYGDYVCTLKLENDHNGKTEVAYVYHEDNHPQLKSNLEFFRLYEDSFQISNPEFNMPNYGQKKN